jgi:hypothetical protein
VRISPAGSAQGRGDSWATAATLDALPGLLPRAVPGTQFLLRADVGAYRLHTPLVLTHGGTATAGIVIRGVDVTGAPRPAELVGDRTEPYDPRGEPGQEAFRLLKGADHLTFSDLAFRNIGNGCIRIGADIADLTIRSVTATNVRRFIEDAISAGEKTATVDGLTVTDVTATGFSRAFARIQYDSHGLRFQHDTGDSHGQDGDPFAEGIELAGTVHDAVLTDVTMTNAVSTQGPYWNGDGFSAEADTYDLHFERTNASGNTDGGYDLKSRSATLIDVAASDNKRNYRFHGTITVEGCTGTNPHMRGGTGSQDQVQATQSAVVTMTGCTFTDDDSGTTVFDVDGTAKLAVTDSTVQHAPGGPLQTVEPGASLQQSAVAVS